LGRFLNYIKQKKAERAKVSRADFIELAGKYNDFTRICSEREEAITKQITALEEKNRALEEKLTSLGSFFAEEKRRHEDELTSEELLGEYLHGEGGKDYD